MQLTPEKTVEWFAYYLFLLGAAVVLAPGLVFAVIMVPPVEGAIVYLAGMLVLLIGWYYLNAARTGAMGVVRATIWGRGFVLAFIGGLVLLGEIAANYLVLGLVDAAGALWTWVALRRSVK